MGRLQKLQNWGAGLVMCERKFCRITSSHGAVMAACLPKGQVQGATVCFQGTPQIDTMIHSRLNPGSLIMSYAQVWPWWSAAAGTEIKASNGRQDFLQTSSICLEFPAHGYQSPIQITIGNTFCSSSTLINRLFTCGLSCFTVMRTRTFLSIGAKDFELLENSRKKEIKL